MRIKPVVPSRYCAPESNSKSSFGVRVRHVSGFEL